MTQDGAVNKNFDDHDLTAAAIKKEEG